VGSVTPDPVARVNVASPWPSQTSVVSPLRPTTRSTLPSWSRSARASAVTALLELPVAVDVPPSVKPETESKGSPSPSLR
jgi:hypothetical protein